MTGLSRGRFGTSVQEDGITGREVGVVGLGRVERVVSCPHEVRSEPEEERGGRVLGFRSDRFRRSPKVSLRGQGPKKKLSFTPRTKVTFTVLFSLLDPGHGLVWTVSKPTVDFTSPLTFYFSVFIGSYETKVINKYVMYKRPVTIPGT